ncbi:binding-protein-dependent transport systems inner membrane component [Halanaerobium praevalens DSM 2228]|uniref:Binding-protein-dependent transport systems inner membrane component n=2 Tax=Halanaerobium praevalens TaxID=2331 RepID=E3DM63_HALPG|nr:binding-protein-dependent transport systems inner membrane component [Halanaerobium praevalens DSM 2228]
MWGKKMNKKAKNKLLEYLITLFLIISLNFILPRLMPGDPFLFISGDQGQDLMYSKAQRTKYLDYYGLNQSLTKQYFSYLKKVFSLDLGTSLYYNQSVLKLILKRLKWTFLIVILAEFSALILAMLIGLISAWYRNSIIDKIIYFKLIVFSELPSFLIGLILLFILAADLNLFPLSGAISHYTEFDSIWDQGLDIIMHAVLPVTALTLSRLGGYYLLWRNTLISVLNKKYIATAQAKALSRLRIIWSYLIKNSLLPICSRLFLSLGSLVGGAILVENVFAYPGLGLLLRESVMMRDYPLIQGIFLVIAIFVLTANFFADLIYKRIDPRIK